MTNNILTSKLAFIVLVFSFMFSEVNATSSPTEAYVLYTGTYGSGDFYVEFDRVIDEPNCPASRFDVPVNNPQINKWLAVAMTSVLTGKRVKVLTNGCYSGRPTLDNTRGTWFMLLDKN